MARLGIFASLFLPLSFSVAITEEKADERKPAPLTCEQAVAVLTKSKDRKELMNAAIDLCKIANPKAIDALAGVLEDPTFWTRLDEEEDYKAREAYLRITEVLKELGSVGTAEAEAALLKLASNKEFKNATARLAGLVLGARYIRKPSAKLVAFVESAAEEENSSLNGINYSLSHMKTPEAAAALIRLGENKLKKADPYTKLNWYVYNVVPLRTQPAALEHYNCVFAIKIDNSDLRNTVVQSLFDYHPLEWYGVSGGGDPEPPLWKDATTEALQDLVKLADVSLKLDVTKDTKAAVEKSKKEIEAILKERQTKK